MALFRLAYVSTSLLSEDLALERREIAHLLLTSRRCNESAEVTGALLATEHHFAQVLEGERADVEDTYVRISRDKRHKDLVLILTEPIAARQFPDWSMAFIGPTQSADEAVARLTQNVRETERGAEARALLGAMGRMLQARTPAAPGRPAA